MSAFHSPALVLAVVSGKGGTGKSTVAVNLAETLADAGRRVALVDADPCQSSCATLANEEPAVSLNAVARGAVALERAFHTTASGVTLVCGGTASPDGLDADAITTAFDAALDALVGTHDVVLIDAPAGLDGAVRWALDRADAGLLVVVGEPTAVAGAYGLVKSVWQAVPEYPFFALANAADTDADAERTLERFAELTTQFVGRAPAPLGWIPYDAHVRRAARLQTPAVRLSPALRSSFGGLAERLTPLLPALALG